MTVIVIHEVDLKDEEEIIIGVATTRDEAMRMINEYYGKEVNIADFRDIRDSGINFDCFISVDGGYYRVTGLDFEINEL